MTRSIETKLKTIKEVFFSGASDSILKAGSKYIIPEYQRAYKWGGARTTSAKSYGKI